MSGKPITEGKVCLLVIVVFVHIFILRVITSRQADTIKRLEARVEQLEAVK